MQNNVKLNKTKEKTTKREKHTAGSALLPTSCVLRGSAHRRPGLTSGSPLNSNYDHLQNSAMSIHRHTGIQHRQETLELDTHQHTIFVHVSTAHTHTHTRAYTLALSSSLSHTHTHTHRTQRHEQQWRQLWPDAGCVVACRGRGLFLKVASVRGGASHCRAGVSTA